jgi:hypothetical protein
MPFSAVGRGESGNGCRSYNPIAYRPLLARESALNEAGPGAGDSYLYMKGGRANR